MQKQTKKDQDEQIRKILQDYQKIAVIGLSPDPNRASYGVSKYLIQQGYELVGVRPGAKEILLRPCYASLADIPGPIEIIDVFRASDAVEGIVEEILQLMKERKDRFQPKVLWLQEGVVDAQAEEKARNAGLQVISDLCILKEHRRLVAK
jgi:predicted CoA-binding protein